jgi:hypothetical protein
MQVGGRQQSAFCFEDGRIAVEDVLHLVPAATPYTVLIADSCYGADVDVRASASENFADKRRSVMSASRRQVLTGEGGGTALGMALARAFVCGDGNQDGLIDDQELLGWLTDYFGDDARAFPRLRRQNWTPLPVLRVGVKTADTLRERFECATAPAPDERELAARVGTLHGGEQRFRSDPKYAARAPARVFWGESPDGMFVAPGYPGKIVNGTSPELRTIAAMLRTTVGFAFEERGTSVSLLDLVRDRSLATFPGNQKSDFAERLSRGAWATLSDERFVWHGGLVEQRPLTIEGRELDGARLTAVPCNDHFGQCFELRDETGRGP